LQNLKTPLLFQPNNIRFLQGEWQREQVTIRIHRTRVIAWR